VQTCCYIAELWSSSRGLGCLLRKRQALKITATAVVKITFALHHPLGKWLTGLAKLPGLLKLSNGQAIIIYTTNNADVRGISAAGRP
jgi:hypothetical protein